LLAAARSLIPRASYAWGAGGPTVFLAARLSMHAIEPVRLGKSKRKLDMTEVTDEMLSWPETTHSLPQLIFQPALRESSLRMDGIFLCSASSKLSRLNIETYRILCIRICL